MESGITVISEQLQEWENHLDNEFCTRQHFFEVWEKHNYDSIIEAVKVVRDLRRAIKFLNSESESTLGQASGDSIADTKVIEKPQGSDAPRLSDQKTVSDPIEKMTSDEKVCDCKAFCSKFFAPEDFGKGKVICAKDLKAE